MPPFLRHGILTQKKNAAGDRRGETEAKQTHRS